MAPITEATIVGTSFTLRPGVAIPDWPLVATLNARRALSRIIETSNRARSWTGMTMIEDRTWQAVFAAFLAQDCPPDVALIARRGDLPAGEVTAALTRLAARDLVVLSPDGLKIRAAYPFSADDVGYRVRFDGRQVYALCAIDALGIGAMCNVDTVIDAQCRACGAPVRIVTRSRGTAIATHSPDNAEAWCGLAEADGCAATSGCTVKVFFCSAPHRDAWLAANPRAGDGVLLSIGEAHMVGSAIFAPMLKVARAA